jgi:hypothetical protein
LLSAFGVELESPALGVASAVLLVGGGAAGLLYLQRAGGREDLARLPAALGLALVAFLLLSKKSYPTYLVLGFFPLCLGLARTRPAARDLVVFGVLGIAATLEMSLWFRWLDTRDLALLWRDPLPDPVAREGVLGFLVCELALLASYAFVLVRLASSFSSGARDVAPPR